MNAIILIVLGILCVLAALNLTRGRTAPTPPPVATPVAPTLDPEALLAPVREQIGVIQKALADNRVAAAEEKATLLKEFQNVSVMNNRLFEQGTRLNEATIQISTALQGTKVSGDWGELQLKRTVELAGMTKHISWVDQAVTAGEDTNIRPDLIVNLPNGRRIIVDAKAPKIDFENSTNAAKVQADALKKHVRDLAAKDYSRYVDGAVDFVVLFVPTEGVLATSLTADPTLSEFAIGSRVLLATPMTLLGMLRSVEYGWKQVAQAENAAIIAKEAAELSDRLATFVDHFNKVGSGLKQAVENFNRAASSFETRLRPQSRKMRELGVPAANEISEVKEISEVNRSVTWDD